MGVTAAAIGLAGAAIGAGASIYSSSKSASAQKKIAKGSMSTQERLHREGEAGREKVSQMARSDQAIARENLLSGEQARLNVLTSLGTPGSYGPSPGSQSGPIQFGALAPTGLGSLAARPSGDVLTAAGQKRTGAVTPGDVGGAYGGVKKWETEGALLDPSAMAAAVEGTAGFRTVSRMVAEAEQLMNRSGPLWDQLNNSVVGGIYESNAAFERQAMEQVSRAMARGGTARRAGLQMAQAFQVQEQVNRQRTGQLWQAKMGLEEYRTKYAQEVTSYSQAWVSNQAGIRDQFSNALQNLQLFWSSTLAPTLAGSTTAAQGATQQGMLNASQGLYQAQQVKSQAISGAVEGIIGAGKQVVGTYLSQQSPGIATGGGQ